MKTLIIIRHAKTHQADWGEKDFDRKLTGRGEKNAKEMADVLKGKGLTPECIISSTAKRAMQTAKIIAETTELGKKEIIEAAYLYAASARAYYQALALFNKKADYLAIVGHNPGITDFAASLRVVDNIDHLPTGSVFAVSADIENWQDFEAAEKKFVLFQSPQGHKN